MSAQAVGHGQRKDSAVTVAEEMIGTVGILHLHRLNQGGRLAFHCLVACGWFRESASCCSDECPIFSKQGNKFSLLFRTPVDVITRKSAGAFGVVCRSSKGCQATESRDEL